MTQGSNVDLTIHELTDPRDQMEFLERNMIGSTATSYGPFGPRLMTYADFTASGRSLRCIEDFIEEKVLPWYGNTHTESSYCGLQTTLFREEARDFIREAVNAPKDEYAVVFTGSGCTGVIHKAINVLQCNEANPCVVFVGPFEHHSNKLAWRENPNVELIRVPQTKYGEFDYGFLESSLQKYKGDKRRKIGSFSAASNVTGILTDTDRVSTLMHKHGGIVMWDYATAGSHVHIDASAPGLAYKDAVFLSPHKFLGGPQTPGILIARKDSVFQNEVPDKCGGGSVLFVSRTRHRYLDDIEAREESGTPAIVESIRSGLVFKVKHAIGDFVIQDRDSYLVEKAIKRLRQIKNVRVLGSLYTKRLPIFAILVLHKESGLYLHHNFVNQLLNDLFGIQCRSGCACAGPYAIDLLGMNEDIEEEFLKAFEADTSKVGSLKPGFCRFNLSFFSSDQESEFILDAVEFICKYGLYFLPFYEMNPESGVWSHWTSGSKKNHFKHLSDFECSDIAERDAQEKYQKDAKLFSRIKLKSYRLYMTEAKKILARILEGHERVPGRSRLTRQKQEHSEELSWFMTQKESVKWLKEPENALAECKNSTPVFKIHKFEPPPDLLSEVQMGSLSIKSDGDLLSNGLTPLAFREHSYSDKNGDDRAAARMPMSKNLDHLHHMPKETHLGRIQSHLNSADPNEANKNMTININISTVNSDSLDQMLQKRFQHRPLRTKKQFSRFLVTDPSILYDPRFNNHFE